MGIRINKNNETPLYIQIKNEIKKEITCGHLPMGYKMPGERQLSQKLCVSRNTIIRAYQELITEGLLIVSAKPKGYFVKEVVEDINRINFHPLSKLIRYSYNERENLFDDIFSISKTVPVISFAGLKVNIYDGWNCEYSLEEFNRCDEEESRRLKINIANLLEKKDIYVSEKNIQLVSETTQAIEYIAALYLSVGDSIIVEEPVMADTVNVFRNKGINVFCAPMDRNGIRIPELEKIIKASKPKFIYVMPNLHNPTGYSMPIENRIRLLNLSSKYGVPIIEENSLGDFRYEGEELPPLFALDKGRMVIYIETFTLTFLPGIKTAYIVGPKETISMIGRMIVTSQMTVYSIGHMMLNKFIESGHYEHRISFLKKYYKEKRDLFDTKLCELKTEGIEYIKPQGGLSFWVSIPEKINEKKLFTESKKQGVIYMPGNLFYPYGYSGRAHARLSFSDVTDDEIVEGINILHACFRK